MEDEKRSEILSEIIGEIGSNHMGKYAIGKQLIDMCIDNNIKYIKLQLWKADDLYKDTPIYETAEKLELKYDLATKLYNYAIDNKLELFFSVFNTEAIDFCEELGVKYYKIAFRTNEDYRILEKVSATNKPTFISFKDNFIPKETRLLFGDNLIPFYTIPKYPPHEQDFLLDNLRDMKGYSNHFKNLYIPKKAIDYGIEWLEIHVMKESLNKNSPDYVCSLDKHQLKELCDYNGNKTKKY